MARSGVSQQTAGTFAELALRSRERPVPVMDLLRAWREDGRYEQGGGAPVGPDTTSRPTDAWAECLRALEHAFAPDELAHVSAAWSEQHRRPRIATDEPQLRERLRRAAEHGGFELAGEGHG